MIDAPIGLSFFIVRKKEVLIDWWFYFIQTSVQHNKASVVLFWNAGFLFKSQAVGINSWVHLALKLILRGNPFFNRLHDFSLLSSNSFLHRFLKSKYKKKILDTKKISFSKADYYKATDFLFDPEWPNTIWGRGKQDLNLTRCSSWTKLNTGVFILN